MIILFLLFVFLTFPNFLLGATLYIDGSMGADCTTGNYSIASRNCTGSNGNAYNDILTARNASAAGDTVYLRSGSITSNATGTSGISVKNGQTWATYSGDTARSAIVTGDSTNQRVFTVDGTAGVHDVVIRDLKIVGSSSGSTQRFAVYITNSARTKVINNEITGWNVTGESGNGGVVYWSQAASPDAVDGEVTDNYVHTPGNPSTDNAGIHIGFQDTGNILVARNRIVGTRMGIWLDISPCNPSLGQTPCTIEDNYIKNVEQVCLHQEIGSTATWRRNICDSPGRFGFLLRPGDGSWNNSGGTKVYNNTFYNAGAADSTFGQTIWIQFDQAGGSVANLEIKNNIIYRSGGAADGEGLMVGSNSTATSTNRYQNNLFHLPTSTKGICWGAPGPGSGPGCSPGISYADTSAGISSWQAAAPSGVASGNIASDPRFANPAGEDFRLCTAAGVPHASCAGASPAINAGINVGLAFSGAAPDIGALEVTGTVRTVQKTSSADTGNCVTAPCLTISYALTQMAAGDTLEIRAGTYNESFNIPSSLSGTSFANGITIKPFTGETATVVMTSAGGGIDVGANFATIGTTTGLLKFNGQNLGTPGNCQHNIGGNGTNVRFYNVDVYDNARLNPNGRPCSGMKPGGINWLISGSRIYGNGGVPAPYAFTGDEAPYGFYWPWQGNGGIIENSEIYDNACIGIQVYSDPAPANVTLRNNRWYRNGRNCYNSLKQPQNGGDIYVVGNGHLIQGNVFYDGSTVPGPSVSVDPGNTIVQYNTFYNLNEGVSIQGSGQTYRNNIFSNIVQGAFRDNGNTATRAANLCFSTSDTGTSTHCQIVGNPLFVNVAAKNFALQSTSPARGAASGTCAGMTDIAGVARPQDGTCDIGAYEFIAPGGAASIAVSGIASPGQFLSAVATATTPASTVTLSGISTCSTSGTGVTWSNNRGGTGSATGGVGTGPQGWTASGIGLTADVVNQITFTTTCSGAGGSASTTIKVRANGADAIVLALPFNENTGTTAVDISGAGNNAAFTGSVANTWVPGKFGSGIRIAANGGLTITNSASLNPSLFTLSAYVFPEVNNVDYRTILRKHPTGGDGGYMFYASEQVLTGCGVAGYAMGGYQPNESGLYRTACSASPLPINTWSHVVITADGQNVKFYLDGTLIQTNPAAELLLENTGALNIGFAGAFGEYFQGTIDELAILNKAVPATGASDANCAVVLTAANASVAKLKNCALGTPAPGQPTSLTIGANSIFTFGPGATATVGVQQ